MSFFIRGNAPNHAPRPRCPYKTPAGAPGFGGQADDGEKHSVDVEIAEESFYDDSVDREGDLRDAEVEADADDVALL